MRYLFILLLFTSQYVYGQGRVEIGLSGGTTLPRLESYKIAPIVISNKQSYGWSIDILSNRFRKPFTVSYGARLMASFFSAKDSGFFNSRPALVEHGALYAYMGLVVSAQYKLTLSDHVACRFSAGAGPIAASNSDGTIHPIAEASVGMMLGKKITLGIKYTKPFGHYYNYNYSDNIYSYSLLQAEIKLLIPDEKHRNEARIIRKERRKSNRELRPYIDVFANVGILFPTSGSASYSYNVARRDKTNTPAKEEIGLEFLFRKRPTQVCASVGFRLGHINLTSTDDTGGRVHDGEGPHFAFSLGLNYVVNSNESSGFRVGLLAGCGIRVDGTSSLFGMNGLLFSEATATKYFNKHLGAGLNVTWYPFLSTLTQDGPKRYEMYAASFQMWSISARLSWTFLRDKKNSRYLTQR